MIKYSVFRYLFWSHAEWVRMTQISMQGQSKWYKFDLYEKNTGGFQFGNIVLRFSAGPRLKIRFLDNEIKLSTRIWQLWRKTKFLSTFWFGQVVSQSYGHQSLCCMHVIKSTHPNFEHTKYEPDMSNHARKKWGVKIAPVFRTPCSSIFPEFREFPCKRNPVLI